MHCRHVGGRLCPMLNDVLEETMTGVWTELRMVAEGERKRYQRE